MYDGTWSGNEPVPAELADFELMLGMKWSWDELQRTPIYVRRYCAEFLGMRAEARARAANRRG